MNATINAFPPLHAFNSPRSWFLAVIVLLHVGFFWALTAGLTPQIMSILPKQTTVEFLPVAKPAPAPPTRPDKVKIQSYVPDPAVPRLGPVEDSETAIQIVSRELPPPDSRPRPEPVVAEPQIDPRIGLSEPVYPSAAIRMNQTGTVMLSVQVFANGRVADVRIEQSSGYPRLDEAAVREARRWRLIPGTRDGVPAVMWKQIPITFRLQ